jgi:hypothetical protein
MCKGKGGQSFFLVPGCQFTRVPGREPVPSRACVMAHVMSCLSGPLFPPPPLAADSLRNLRGICESLRAQHVWESTAVDGGTTHHALVHCTFVRALCEGTCKIVAVPTHGGCCNASAACGLPFVALPPLISVHCLDNIAVFFSHAPLRPSDVIDEARHLRAMQRLAQRPLDKAFRSSTVWPYSYDLLCWLWPLSLID